MAEPAATITANLAQAFHYSFVETVPYAFFKPNPERDIAVNLRAKEYRCEKCGRVTRVTYRNEGVTYYSKGKLAEERRIYDTLGLSFPYMGEINDGVEFTNEAYGYCQACAQECVLQSMEPAQRAYNLAELLHTADMLVLSHARDDAEQALTAYRGLVKEVQEQEEELLTKLPDKFRAYAVRPTRAPESMSDKLYHEYTIAFPADDAPNELYYIERELEKSRVEMFLAQPRIETIEELRREAGL